MSKASLNRHYNNAYVPVVAKQPTVNPVKIPTPDVTGTPLGSSFSYGTEVGKTKMTHNHSTKVIKNGAAVHFDASRFTKIRESIASGKYKLDDVRRLFHDFINGSFTAEEEKKIPINLSSSLAIIEVIKEIFKLLTNNIKCYTPSAKKKSDGNRVDIIPKDENHHALLYHSYDYIRETVLAIIYATFSKDRSLLYKDLTDINYEYPFTFIMDLCSIMANHLAFEALLNNKSCTFRIHFDDEDKRKEIKVTSLEKSIKTLFEDDLKIEYKRIFGETNDIIKTCLVKIINEIKNPNEKESFSSYAKKHKKMSMDIKMSDFYKILVSEKIISEDISKKFQEIHEFMKKHEKSF